MTRLGSGRVNSVSTTAVSLRARSWQVPNAAGAAVDDRAPTVASDSSECVGSPGTCRSEDPRRTGPSRGKYRPKADIPRLG